MIDKSISRFPILQLEDIPADIKEKIIAVQEKTGFIPNVFLAMASHPEECRAFFAYHDFLMHKESGLTKGEREMIVVTTSALNECLYCIISHGAVLRIREKSPIISDQLANNYRKAAITTRQRAMLDFAVKVSQHSNTVNEEDYDTLKAHGFSEGDIWDIGAITAFFAMSNRLANMASIMPNKEFYGMGRNV